MLDLSTKPTALWLLFALCGVSLLVRPISAQEDERGDQADEIAQLFGQGNGIRGSVIEIGSSSFIVRTDEGESYKVLYSPNTRIMKERQPAHATDVHLGDELIAAGQLDNEARTLGAVFLFDVDAAQVRKAREGFGKTWTAGKVIAIQDLKITISVIGGKETQTVAVDENTSFRQRNESVTLADIKVGEFISARGTVHDKVFAATLLRVMDPGERRSSPSPGNRGGSGQGAPSPFPAPSQPRF